MSRSGSGWSNQSKLSMRSLDCLWTDCSGGLVRRCMRSLAMGSPFRSLLGKSFNNSVINDRKRFWGRSNPRLWGFLSE